MRISIKRGGSSPRAGQTYHVHVGANCPPAIVVPTANVGQIDFVRWFMAEMAQELPPSSMYVMMPLISCACMTGVRPRRLLVWRIESEEDWN